MPLGIIAAQTFTDKRGVDHTSAYGKIVDVHIQPLIKFAEFRLDFYVDQAKAEEGDFNANIESFEIAFSGADFDTFFAESVLALVDNTVDTQAEIAMLAAEDRDENKIIDNTIFEIV